MGIRAERKARAKQKIEDLKRELLEVFLDAVDKKFTPEAAIHRFEIAVAMAMKRNPQEAHLVHTAYIRLEQNIKEMLSKPKKRE